MEKEFLEECLARGMSLPQIGELANRPAGTVGYWVAKHGLIANGREKFSPSRRQAVARESLEPLVMEGMTVSRIADELGVGVNCVRYWIDKYGLPQPIEVRRTLRSYAMQSGDTSSVRDCDRHGRTDFVRDARGTWRCRRCRGERVAERRRRVKQILVVEAGGECCLCGYNRSAAALHFHHVDPGAKRFTISNGGYSIGIDRARAEASKCVLLCANCHAEVEAGVAQVPRGLDEVA